MFKPSLSLLLEQHFGRQDVVQYSEQIFYTVNTLALCQEFTCRSQIPAPLPPSTAPSTFSKPLRAAATGSPIPKSAAGSAFPRVPQAIFCAPSSAAVTCAAKRKPGATGSA